MLVYTSVDNRTSLKSDSNTSLILIFIIFQAIVLYPRGWFTVVWKLINIYLSLVYCTEFFSYWFLNDCQIYCIQVYIFTP